MVSPRDLDEPQLIAAHPEVLASPGVRFLYNDIPKPSSALPGNLDSLNLLPGQIGNIDIHQRVLGQALVKNNLGALEGKYCHSIKMVVTVASNRYGKGRDI